MTHLGRWLSALVDGELDGPERDHVLSHLARCESCLREASALRALKRRMGGLGDAAAGSDMTNRLIGLAGPGDLRSARSGSGSLLPRMAWVGHLRARNQIERDLGLAVTRRTWQLVAGVTTAAIAVIGAAAFMLGGSGQPPAPRITPAVDAYWTQHGFDTGQAPARPSAPTGNSGLGTYP
jgi:anti-sigma factor RsiW